jgi:DNA-binding HxlR family transcriptional regulator
MRISGHQHLEHDEHVFCPVNATLDLLNQRWNLRIVRTLLDGKKRFNEIGRAHGINPRTLRERLRALEQQGIVKRTVISEMPPNVEYSLTEKGQALNEIFEALVEWGVKWMEAPAGTEKQQC